MQGEEYPKRVYFLPSNFALDGKAIGGVAWANLIEAAVLFVIFLVPDILFVPGVAKKIYGAVVCAVPAIIAIIGVNGLSLSSFFADFLHYRACSTIYAKPTSDAILIRERQILKEKHRLQEAAEKERKKEEKMEKRLEKRKRKEEKKSKDTALDLEPGKRKKKSRHKKKDDFILS